MRRVETNCDVLVVGAGPAGMRAACAASAAGARTLVLDENGTPGGQIWRAGMALGKEDDAAARQARHARSRFQASGAGQMPWTRVFDAEPDDLLALREAPGQAEELLRVRYRALVLATGARERFLPFPGWTLPGVYGAGGLQALVKGGMPIQSRRVVVAGSGPLLLAVAAHLRAAGARLVGLYEQAPAKRLLPFALRVARDAGRLMQGAGYVWTTRGTRLRTGCWPVAALGRERLEAVRITDGRRTWTVPCDALACGFHLEPNTELAQLLGCRLRADGSVEIDAVGRTTGPRKHIFCAGEPTGVGGLELAETEGTLAGAYAAADALNAPVPLGERQLAALLREAARLRAFASALNRTFALRPELRNAVTPDTIVCRCEDVRYGALITHRGWREAKLQTRCGMGPCQGRICGPALRTLLGWKPESVRPPLTPVPVAAMAADWPDSIDTDSTDTKELEACNGKA